MAAPLETSQHQRGDSLFITALLLSMVLHAILLYLMPRPTEETPPTPTVLSVELQPRPKPIPPPAPPKPQPEPEKEKPKPQPKKPLPPKPQPAPTPHAVEPPVQQAPEPARPSQPPVIAAPPPPSSEPPREFVTPPPQPEPSPRPKGPSEQDLENARGVYKNLLHDAITKYVKYPPIADRRGWEGTAMLEVRLTRNGDVISIKLTKSTGFDMLDNQALEAARKAVPLPLPPEILRNNDFIITIPLTYQKPKLD